MELELSTKAPITWCPGCPNGAILVAAREAITELVEAGKLKKENIVAMSGIGCHGKITDYLKLNTFTSLHGRVLAAMTGVRCGNPDLTVIGFTGDGDSFSEGLDHLLHAAKRNSDIKVFLHNNQVFALTTGQVTPLSPKGQKGKSTPLGSIEEPFNPLSIMLEAGATFLARSYAEDIPGTKKMMLAAIEHKGFAFVEILQPCLIFCDTRSFYDTRVHWISNQLTKGSYQSAHRLITDDESEKIPLGIFYQVKKPIFEDELGKTI